LVLPHRRRERERERRLEAKEAHGSKKSKITRDRDRDISEKVPGLAVAMFIQALLVALLVAQGVLLLCVAKQ
jgi:hypothetical protein